MRISSGLFILVDSTFILRTESVDNNIIPEGEGWVDVTNDPLGLSACKAPADYEYRDGKLHGK